MGSGLASHRDSPWPAVGLWGGQAAPHFLGAVLARFRGLWLTVFGLSRDQICVFALLEICRVVRGVLAEL